MATWRLTDAEEIRRKLTKEQENEISKLYKQTYIENKKKLQSIPKKGTVTQQLQQSYLKGLIKDLEAAYKSIGTGLEETIKKNMEKVGQAVINDNIKFLEKGGIIIKGSFSRVPRDVVNSLVSGQLYEGNWSLSKAIWKDIDKHQKDINSIVARGVANNKSAYDIAKDLEMYVDPSARKPWDWSKVYPNTNKVIDYNAQRLARTMVSHAYQQSLERACKNNPFVSGYIWQASSSRPCPICQDRNGQFYKKGELPLDHPNGMCTFLVEISDMREVADTLADWVHGKSNSALDKWYFDIVGKSL